MMAEYPSLPCSSHPAGVGCAGRPGEAARRDGRYNKKRVWSLSLVPGTGLLQLLEYSAW